ncbi:GNAT family N-acetyltransferase [Thalassotalea ganghwensis]
MTIVCQTSRLIVRHLAHADADFIIRLLNEPAFIEYIGDKGVRNREDAIEYIEGPIASYKANGFGLSAVIERQTLRPVGLCGVLKRAELDLPDLGYSLLPEFWGLGYAKEAATGVLESAHVDCRIDKIAAITSPNNQPSIAVLEKLGFAFVDMKPLFEGEPAVRYFEKAFK